MMMQAGDLITQHVSHGMESAAPPMTAGQVTAFGPGLSHGVAGQSCNFTIVTKDAGAGQQINSSFQFMSSVVAVLFSHLNASSSASWSN